MKRILLILIGVLVAIPFLFAMVALFYPRPENLTPAHVYQGDAHAINYCDLPVLDGKLAGASNDVSPRQFGSSTICLRSSATTEWVEGRLQFYALGLVPVVARYIEDGEYKWDFPSFGTTTMKRICKLPEGA